MTSLNVPNSFSNNTTADANKVNENFEAIEAWGDVHVIRADGSVKAGTISIADAAITNVKIDYTSVPRTTIATTDPTGGKDGDVWIKVV